MDTGEVPGNRVWVHAGPRRAEAGFEDPTLGWVGVRAEQGAGGVHAVVVPGSTGAAAELGAHLGSLASFLSDRHVGVSSVELGSPSGGGLEAGSGNASAGHDGRQGRGSAGNGAAEVTGSSEALRGTGPPSAAAAVSDWAGPVATRAGRADGVGTHLSVVA